ncbi:MAG: alpha/beta hydrolase, partial [Caldilineaceae bacterium]|nr:alpha/beta hydrolase [Caldilineaceae bacterium]
MCSQPAVIRNTVVHQLYPAAIDQKYVVTVQLPYRYHDDADARYPVLYLLDGDQFFGMVTDTVRLLQHAKELPDLIVVGIGYGTDAAEHFVQRVRDYAPSAVEQYPFAGGAAAFHSFLTDEVIPFVDAHYRTN